MGTVFEATDRANGARVAVKLVDLPDPDSSLRFDREATLLSSLSHPSILRYIAHGRADDSTGFLVTERLEGWDLEHALATRLLSADEVSVLIRAITPPLAAAHAVGIVHRDIKPSNVFLLRGQLDQVRLLDFGIARRVASDAVTRTGTAVGTPAYMAPEQASGDRALGPSADVFSFGALLFHAVTGRPPFIADHVFALLAKVLLEEPPRLRAITPTVPEWLDALVHRMLRKDPQERPTLDDVLRLSADHRTSERDGYSRSTPPSLATVEQTLVSVVLVARDRTPVRVDARTEPIEPQELNLALSALPGNASVISLVDGSTVISIGASGRATDAARMGAACAVAIRDALPARAISLALGRARPGTTESLGPAIDRAAALLDDAEPGVVIDPALVPLLEASFTVEHRASGTYLAGPLPEPSYDTSPSPSLFVGRETELAQLVALACVSMDESAPRAAVVTGGAGSGKSRLRQEMLGALTRRGIEMSLWTSRGAPLGTNLVFGVLAGLIASAAGYPERAGQQRRIHLRNWVVATMGAERAANALPFLAELAGIGLADEVDPALRAARHDPSLMSQRLAAAWTDLVVAALERGPLVWIVDDLQWADGASLRMIEQAWLSAPNGALFLIGLGREDALTRFPDLWSRTDPQRIAIRALSRKASERLLALRLRDPLDRARIDRLVDLASGNPFFLEELARSANAGRPAADNVSVLALLEDRLGALSASARRMLRIASVLGVAFPRRALLALAGDTEEDAVRELVAAELLSQTAVRDPAETELSFRQPLVRDAAYAMLIEEDRELGHRLAAEWMAAEPEAEAAVLAEHWALARDTRRASAAFAQACEGAIKAHELELSLALVRRALAIEPRSAQLLVIEGRTLQKLGRPDEASALLQHTNELGAGSPPWWSGIRARLASHHQCGEIDALLADGRLVLEHARGPLDREMLDAAAVAAAVLTLNGYLTEAEPLLKIIPDTPDDSLPTSVGSCRSIVASFTTRDSEKLIWSEWGLARALSLGDLRQACIVRSNLGIHMASVGRNDEAEVLLEAARAEAQRLSYVYFWNLASTNLAILRCRQHRIADARALIEQASSYFRTIGDHRMFSICRLWEARTFLAESANDRAAQIAHSALTAGSKSPAGRGQTAVCLAEALFGAGRPAEALAVLEEHALPAGRAHIEFGDARLRLAHAKALRAVGDEAGSMREISRARAELVNRASGIDTTHRDALLTAVQEHAETLALAAAWVGVAPT